jgi:hypothetical protein
MACSARVFVSKGMSDAELDEGSLQDIASQMRREAEFWTPNSTNSINGRISERNIALPLLVFLFRHLQDNFFTVLKMVLTGVVERLSHIVCVASVVTAIAARSKA